MDLPNEPKELSNKLADIEPIKTNRLSLERHRVFDQLITNEDLQLFMSWHVFSVWSHMSIIKRLQLEFTCTCLPWTPYRSAKAAYLINKIVSENESTALTNNTYLSQFELYLCAMEEIGANTFSIRTFVDLIAANMPLQDALKISNASPAIDEFVLTNTHIAISGSVEEVLGCMIYADEYISPKSFMRSSAGSALSRFDEEKFSLYLKMCCSTDPHRRHSDITNLLIEQTNGNESRLKTCLDAALGAIKRQANLWDALACKIEIERCSLPETMQTT